MSSLTESVRDIIRLSEDALFAAAAEGKTAVVLSALSTTSFRKDAIGSEENNRINTVFFNMVMAFHVDCLLCFLMVVRMW